MAQNDRFIRWQATTIAQFGFVNNVFLVLATGALGFSLTMLDGAALGSLLCLSIAALIISVAWSSLKSGLQRPNLGAPFRSQMLRSGNRAAAS